MATTLAYCGLSCEQCTVHLATVERDPDKKRALRGEVVRMCRELYALELTPEQVEDCDGCRAGARLFSGCRDCLIRRCAAAREVETCADCMEYPCATLELHLAHDPEARARLEALRV